MVRWLPFVLACAACGSFGDVDQAGVDGGPGQPLSLGSNTPGSLTSTDFALPPGASGINADFYTLHLAAGQVALVAMCRCTTNTSGDMDPVLVVPTTGVSDDDCGGNHGAAVRLAATTDTTFDIFAEDVRGAVPSDGNSRRYVMVVQSVAPATMFECYAGGGAYPTEPCPPFPPSGFGCP